MLKRLDEGTENVLDYEVKGKLTQEEFENFSAEIKSAITEHGKVRLLIRMNEIPRMELGALTEDLKLTRHANDLERYAIVSDSTTVGFVEEFGEALIGGEVKHFEDGQYDEAWRWVQA